MGKLTIVAIACAGCWVWAALPAAGQSARFQQHAPQGSRPYYAGSSRVSPYLNLGVTANGVTTYQTLVRPLIEEREEIDRQSAALDRLNRRVQTAVASGDWREVEMISRRAQPERGVRFLATRFSAKEAFSKAIGLGMRMPMTWRLCEIANLPGGQPVVVLHGGLRAWFEERGLSAHVTVTDESDYAASFVVVEKKDPA